MTHCIDPVVGDILAGWRYDISGLAPEMRGDYETHLRTCRRCRARQQLHRAIDLGLIVLTTISAGLFLMAFAVVRYLSPRHAIVLEIIALGGFAVSLAVWVIVAIATPAPMVMVDVARVGARRLQDRLPEHIRERLPEEIRNI
jgi:hypothetical protein